MTTLGRRFLRPDGTRVPSGWLVVFARGHFFRGELMTTARA